MVREFRVYSKDQLLMEGASPLDLTNLTPHTTYDLEITTWDGKLESERVPVPQFKTDREQLVQGFTSPHRSTDYLVGTWASKKTITQGKTYMVELVGTKPSSQHFGFYVGAKLIGYFVPKNTGGNKYTMIFEHTSANSNEFKLYQYPNGTAGQVELTKFSVVEIDVSENLLDKESLSKLPISTTDYNVFGGTLTKDWEYGKRYYVRIKGTKLTSQKFTLYVDGGDTNMGNVSNINGTDIWEATFTVNKWAIDRGAKRTFMIFQTPQSTKGQVDISEIVVLETNEAVLPTSLNIVPNEFNLKVGQSSNSQFVLTPPNAENYETNFIGWQSGVASNSTADPTKGFTVRGTTVGSFTATVRSTADPSVETQVKVNVTAAT